MIANGINCCAWIDFYLICKEEGSWYTLSDAEEDTAGKANDKSCALSKSSGNTPKVKDAEE